jgi:hypothetical protein
MANASKWFGIFLFIGACSADPDPGPEPARGGVGKADLAGSCEGACGQASTGTCWCDDDCDAFGDCCEDKPQWCEAPVPEGEVPAIRMDSPISLDVLVVSFEDQVQTMAEALAVPEAAALLDELRDDALEDHAAIVVSAFANPLPGTFCRTHQCRETFVALETFRIGQDNEPAGLLFIRNFADPSRPDDVAFDEEATPPLGMTVFASPISLNVLVDSMSDQLEALRDALRSPPVVDLIASITGELAEQSAVPVVSAFESPLPGSFCRENQCRDTHILVERFAIGADNDRVGVLQIRNFADPDRPDDAVLAP